jgi:voltage-gated potassium channel
VTASVPRDPGDRRHDRWKRATEWPLTIASILFLGAYSWQVIGNLQGDLHHVTETIINVTWAMFAVDYIVNLVLAPQRWTWFRRHLLDLAIVALPVLRPLRLLRLLTVLRQLNNHASHVIRRKVSTYTVGATLLLIYVAGLAVLDAERDGGTIQNFGDAVWWAFVTMTTVGYGDFVPYSPVGRMVAVGLMIGGIALIGVVTATLASWIIDRISDETRAEAPATAEQIAELQEQIRVLTARLDAPGDTPDRGASS